MGLPRRGNDPSSGNGRMAYRTDINRVRISENGSYRSIPRLPVPVSEGGTGATTVVDARTWPEVYLSDGSRVSGPGFQHRRRSCLPHEALAVPIYQDGVNIIPIRLGSAEYDFVHYDGETYYDSFEPMDRYVHDAGHLYVLDLLVGANRALYIWYGWRWWWWWWWRRRRRSD